MTTRNLNRTWRDVVFAQYAADYEADAPFPYRYLIHARQWNRDIIISIPQKIDLRTFKRSIANFFKTLHTAEDPTYQDENISLWSRKRVSHQTGDTGHTQDELEVHHGRDEDVDVEEAVEHRSHDE